MNMVVDRHGVKYFFMYFKRKYKNFNLSNTHVFQIQLLLKVFQIQLLLYLGGQSPYV